MTVDVTRDILSATSTPRAAQPVAFDGLFGWFSPGHTRRGVVLCGTLGFEQLSAYRAWRALTEDIATTGCPTLRFDYPGEGDSADTGAGRMVGLVASVRRAIRYLREEAGVEEIVLVGLRLGATIAALAAQEGGVDRLVLLAPFTTGRAYMREMQLQARTTLIWPGGVPLQSKPGTLNIHGFVMSQDLIDDINSIDDHLYRSLNVSDILIVDKILSGSLSKLFRSNIDLKNEIFSDFSKLLSGEMNFKSVSDVVGIFRGLNRIVAKFCTGGVDYRNKKFSIEHSLSHIAGIGWREETIFFGDGLFGIVCKSTARSVKKCSVIFINSGTYVRSGPSRYTTRLARELAAWGVTSFRIDLRGTGDSSDWLDEKPPFYNLNVLKDIKSAIDQMDFHGKLPIIIFGSCSGAYLAFHATCEDSRISDAILINLYCFDWPSDQRFEEVIDRPTVRSTAIYARSLRNVNTWRRLLAGNISVYSITTGMIKYYLRSILKRWTISIISPNIGSSAIERVGRVRCRGGCFMFVYSAEDPALINIIGELGLSLKNLRRELRSTIEIVERCDHNFSTPESQDFAAAVLTKSIERRTHGDCDKKNP